MPNIVFTKGGDTFTFSKGREFPVDDPAQVNVPVDYSDGGQLYAYDKGIPERFHNLVFRNLPQIDRDEVDEWLRTTVVGPKNTFVYTDEDGANHYVRLLDTRMPLRETSSGMFGGTIQLREEN